LEAEPEGGTGDGKRVVGRTFTRRQPTGGEQGRRHEGADRELHPAAEGHLMYVLRSDVRSSAGIVRRRREHLPLGHVARKRKPPAERTSPLSVSSAGRSARHR